MSDKHEQALDLTEKALDALDHGDTKAADALLEEAKSIDATAVEEVVADLDEAGDMADPDEDEDGDEDEDEDDLDEDDDDEDDEDEDEDEVPGIDEEDDDEAADEEEAEE